MRRSRARARSDTAARRVGRTARRTVRASALRNSSTPPTAALQSRSKAFRGAVPVLLPLDRGRWLGADVVDDAVHTAHLVDDTARDAREHVVRERIPIG